MGQNAGVGIKIGHHFDRPFTYARPEGNRLQGDTIFCGIVSVIANILPAQSPGISLSPALEKAVVQASASVILSDGNAHCSVIDTGIETLVFYLFVVAGKEHGKVVSALQVGIYPP